MRTYNSGLPEARQATPFDRELWKQWEGQSVDSIYPLGRCTGGSSRGAVFETTIQDQPAAIKIVPGTTESIHALLTAASQASRLSHPALVKILASGETELGGMHCAYIVMERADDNLADLLTERLLTPGETREMLHPVLAVLQYLAANGFAHGRLKPANIMATGEQIKISSDGLVAGADEAADCRALGLVLQEVLGAGPNAPLPEPFAEIAKNCLMPNPASRWNLARIGEYLRSHPASQPPARSRTSAKGAARTPKEARNIFAPHSVLRVLLRRWWAAAAIVAVMLGLGAIWSLESNHKDQSAPASRVQGNAVPFPPAGDIKPSAVQAPGPKQSPAKGVTKASAVAKEMPISKPPHETKAALEKSPVVLDGITRVMPEIPQQALNTITGRVRINVRVRVSSGGSVNNAILEPPSAAKYFTSRVLAAAKAWKFPAENDPQDWVLHFELSRDQIRVSPMKIVP